MTSEEFTKLARQVMKSAGKKEEEIKETIDRFINGREEISTDEYIEFYHKHEPIDHTAGRHRVFYGGYTTKSYKTYNSHGG